MITMQASIQITDGIVRQIGTSLGPFDGCEVLEISEEQSAAIKSASYPNGGIVIESDGSITVLPAATPEVIP